MVFISVIFQPDEFLSIEGFGLKQFLSLVVVYYKFKFQITTLAFPLCYLHESNIKQQINQ